MARRSRGGRHPLDELADVRDLGSLADGLQGDARSSIFLRGLTVGALVGAAIAGSLLFGRRGRKTAEAPAPDAADTEPQPPDSP